MRTKTPINQGWTVRTQTIGPVAAMVPGTVHEALLAAGLKGDPFWREQELDWQEVDRWDWIYETVLPLAVTGRRDLVCEGLDTVCEVRLDGHLLAQTDDMHRSWRFGLPQGPGGERLSLTFRSATEEGLRRLAAHGFALQATNDQSQRGGLGDQAVSPFLRKAGYHFGWDWGPRLVTSGPWRPVSVETWSHARIADLFVRTVSLSSDRAEVEVTATWEVLEAGEYKVDFSVSAGGPLVQQSLDLPLGASTTVWRLVVDQPQLWWCLGQGESYLYEASLRLSSGGTAVDSRDLRFGIRTVELRRQPDAFGESFTFVLNGRPVFAKGANWIPNDLMLPRITPEHLESVIRSAADSHMNMLRVWGGGIFEEDRFYDLCDQLGILVWQDFLFACTMYPGDPAFLENVRAEAVDNVVRLRNHPCLALWCGNNEIDSAWWRSEEGKGWGWKEKYPADQRHVQEQAYDTLFHNILPSVVEQCHPGSAYWPSSPWPGADRGSTEVEGNTGDVHFWGVWHQRNPFERFDEILPRFMSEYGFQSFPDPWGLRQFSLPEDRALESPVMKAHQRSGDGNRLIRQYMEDWSRVPEDFDRFVLASQVLQARAMTMAIGAHRRNRPRVMGTLYWQLNDCWPAASWSSLDWKGRWKAAHYAARRMYQPLILSVVAIDDGLEVWAVNDDPVARSGTLTIRWWTLEGVLLADSTRTVSCPAGSALRLGWEEMQGAVGAFSWTQDGQEVARTLWWADRPKDRPRLTEGLEIQWQREGGFSVTISSAVPVETVVLWTEKTGELVYSDNFFSLVPGEKKTVTLGGAGVTGLGPQDFFIESDASW